MQLTNLPRISSPMPWHDRQWSHLVGQLETGKFPHALMLCAEQHTGLSQLALALSRLLLCAQPEDGLNCGQCHACDLSGSGGHGDFAWVQPGNKSRVIKVDQVREVVQFTHMTAGFGARKVVVLAPADSMNVNAFNALLKTLEEPASDTYVLLVCHRLHGVPATIRSRCQMWRLPVPPAERSLQWLEGITGRREESEKLLSLADGRPLLAEHLYQADGAEELAARRMSFRGLLSGRIDSSQAGSLWGDITIGEFLEQFSEEIVRILRPLSADQLRSRQARSAFALLDELAALQKSVSAGANPSKQLLVDALLAKFRRELGGGLLGDNIQAHAAGEANT